MEDDEQGGEQKAPVGIPTIAGAEEVKAPEAVESGKSKDSSELEKARELSSSEKKVEEAPKKEELGTHIFALRTTANREDQVMDFLVSNIKKKKLPVFAVIRPHGMRGYIFVEAADRQSAEQAAFNVPYARGILPKEINYSEIEHMLEQVKREVDIRKNDIVEIIAGPFKREQAKVTRIDKTKEEVVVELLGAAVPIPITVKMDAVKVIRRESEAPAEAPAEEEL
ncbi:MAG: transcription elongation factor Spt5 [Candidatus Woesearchaeota archaeon]